jgi:hypothetical protein
VALYEKVRANPIYPLMVSGVDVESIGSPKVNGGTAFDELNMMGWKIGWFLLFVRNARGALIRNVLKE